MEIPTLSTQVGYRDYFFLRYFSTEDRFDVVRFMKGYSSGTVWGAFYPTGFSYLAPWKAIAMSGNGNKIFVGTQRLSLSSNRGVTWVEKQVAGDADRGWSVSMSADGLTLLAGDSLPGRLWLSVNGGTSFTEKRPSGADANKGWEHSAISSDGTYIVVAENTTPALWRSADGGANWSNISPTALGTPRFWRVQISNDGAVIIAADIQPDSLRQKLWLSTNGGSSWTDISPSAERQWYSTAMSSDGVVILAGGRTSIGGGYRAFFSLNQGSSWTETRPEGDIDVQYDGADMSGDGSVWYLGASGLYRSVDQGTTWELQDLNPLQPGTASHYGEMSCSEGGAHAAAVGDDGAPGFVPCVLLRV